MSVTTAPFRTVLAPAADGPARAAAAPPTIARPRAAPRMPGAAQPRREPPAGYRGDVEGLRAVAVVLVVAFHAGIGWLSGGYVGVDVFFVLSGFLITGLLVDELRRTGTVSLTSFWARRARRLLPISALVLVVTAVASYLILPPLDHGGIGSDVRAAALFVANWHFAAESTQYMADTDKSPVLHYWSLAVEEQFYIVWPLLLLLVARTVRGTRRWLLTFRRLVLVLALVGLGSFLMSITLTDTSNSFAYFGTHTRAWELAVGGGLALAGTRLLRIPRAVAALAGWAGLGLIGYAALVLDELTPFPGTAALLPVAGTALLVASGARVRTAGAAGLLSARPLRYVGRISYAWYLWHWPCLVLAGALTVSAAGAEPSDGSAPHLGAGVVLIAVLLSFLLAVLSHHLLEQPVRRARWLARVRGRSLALGATLTALSVLAASGEVAQTVSGPASTAQDTRVLGGASLQPIPPDESTPNPTAPAPPSASKSTRSTPATVPARLLPGAVVLAGPDASRTQLTAAEARLDSPKIPPEEGCYAGFDTTSVGVDCTFGAPNGTKTIVLMGDSHAMQWFPTLNRLAKKQGWTIRLWGKSGCPLVDVPIRGKGPYPECDRWRTEVLKRVAALPHVDAVILGRAYYYGGRLLDDRGAARDLGDAPARWEQGARSMFERLRRMADRVIVMRDSPTPAGDVPACLSQAPNDLRRCDFPRTIGVHTDHLLADAERRAAEGMTGISSVDMSEDICPVDPCPAVTRDGTIMFRDSDHLAASFSARLWRALGRELQPVLAS